MGNETKFTPGSLTHGVDSEAGHACFEVYHSGTRQSTAARINNRADAILYAAAPELFEACKAVLERANGKLYDTDQVTGETFDTLLRAAIAKAEGK
jgi:hypothetical protein